MLIGNFYAEVLPCERNNFAMTTIIIAAAAAAVVVAC